MSTKNTGWGLALGLACVALGASSIYFDPIPAGAAVGLAGLGLSIFHLAKRFPYLGLGIAGVVLSAISVLIGAALLILLVFVSSTQDEKFEAHRGKPAPDITLKLIDGSEIKLSDLKGKRVLLDFWATWCGPCKEEIPHLMELRKTTSPNQLAIIGISDEPAAVIRAFSDKTSINYSMASLHGGPPLPAPYSLVESIPTLFVIDANGTIESVLSGYKSFEQLKQAAVK